MEDSTGKKIHQQNITEESEKIWMRDSNVESDSKLPKVALIVDVENWAFHNYAKQISLNLKDKYDFKIFFYAGYPEIEDLMFEVKDFDLIHFFWRDALFSYLTPQLQHSFVQKGLDYYDFITNTVAKANITTSIYDHLFLSESEIEKRVIVYNALSIGYTTVSKRLENVYSNIPQYPKPFGAVEDGVDLDFFVPRSLERLTDADREILVGWVGNSKWGGDGIDHKGIETIIKPVVESLREEGYKVRGHYADRHVKWIPHSEMNDYYNSIDIYVCASDIEGTPNPALESMACGIPVVSTDVGMIPQLFGAKQKEYILGERTQEALREKLIELIGSPQKRAELSRENLESISHWSWEKQCQKWDDFFGLMLFISREKSLKQRSNYMRQQLLSTYLLSMSEPVTNEVILENVVENPVDNTELNIQYDELKAFADNLQDKINLMEQSQFWKVRNEWFKFKKILGFAKDKY